MKELLFISWQMMTILQLNRSINKNTHGSALVLAESGAESHTELVLMAFDGITMPKYLTSASWRK
jgi:hypothetical protein